MAKTLDRDALLEGVAELTRLDGDLRAIVSQYGCPPMWRRSPGFATLAQIILEQQVSLASARALYARLRARLGRVSAGGVMRLGEHGLRRVGVTRQKSAYLVQLARTVTNGSLAHECLRVDIYDFRLFS